MLTGILILAFVWLIIRKKQIHIWLGSYVIQNIFLRNKLDKSKPVHIMFCLVDHFEPQWNGASYETEVRRVDKWVENYPRFAQKFKDVDGKFPQLTFFYPAEEYRAEHLEKLSNLCKMEFGEVEIHLHHSNDTSKGFREKILQCKNNYASHGLLSKDNRDGETKFGFIHGNWALDNSRGNSKWCGVNDELRLLKELGCYADFTLPSAPDKSQTKTINSIYYATDDPERPKSHDIGVSAKVGVKASGDLMIIQGPLTLNWKRRKKLVLPRIENGEIAYNNPPTKERVDLWIKQHIHVKGKPDWVFVKVYTHGAQEGNSHFLLGKDMELMHLYLNSRYNDQNKFFLHYVTAREMFNVIKAAEDGLAGDPNNYRDYILKKNNNGTAC